MARHDVRPRGTRAPDLGDFEDDDQDLFEASDGLEEFDDLTGSGISIPHHSPHLGGKRSAKGKAKGKGRAPSVVADEDDELDLDEEPEPRPRDRKRVEVSEGFKCRHCRNFIGIPPSGGRNRNHCPICLYSLHVDDKTPGDRASDCRSLMQPIGVFYRPKGEQMVVHRCLGCGFVRYNRIAADDNPVVLAELPVLDPPQPGTDWSPGE